MKFRTIFPILAAAIAAVGCNAPAGGRVDVIPYPQEVRVGTERIQTVSKLVETLDSRMPAESYELKVGKNGKVSIKAADSAGLFYAHQTLGQQLAKGGAAVGTIKDAPRYVWRGFMLDESRHFSGMERVKWILDEMARLKMNKFHWHLTDAQGWRIEIKSWPYLAEIGGQGNHSDIDAPAQYYTQEQIREIVRYAAERHIEIIPEIDMPGHASAANKAYPQFSGGGVSAGFPAFTFNVGKPETYAFIEDVLTEVAELFPAPYIMIGGDEVSYGSYAWLADKDITAMMAEKGYTDVLQAEGYFIREISKLVKDLGKQMIGWDDIVDFGVPSEGNLMMWWRHDNVGRLHDVLDGGYQTILCPRKPMYFDFVQHDDHKVGRKWDGFCPIEDVYSFPDAYYEHWGVSEADLSQVIGVQSNLWSELTHNTDRVDFMVFPRIFATAESAWTLPQNKDYSRFETLLEAEYDRLDTLGIYYYDYRDPEHHSEPAGPVLGVRPVDRKAFRTVVQEFRD